jgi:hypothetical protein
MKKLGAKNVSELVRIAIKLAETKLKKRNTTTL